MYYECSSAFVLDLHTCESGSKYDYKKKKCRVERPEMKRRIRCTPPCDEENNNKRKQEDENEEPKVDAKTETPTEEGKPNVTSKQMESTTESNKPLTTTTERNDTGVKVAGNLVPDNDTINAAMVDPNVPNLPADSANTTAGETVEETEAQTEKDIITTVSPSTASTSPPTVPPTTKPSTKPTTKSTTTTQPGVIVVETDGDPGYDIVTSPPSNSSGSAGELMKSRLQENILLTLTFFISYFVKASSVQRICLVIVMMFYFSFLNACALISLQSNRLFKKSLVFPKPKNFAETEEVHGRIVHIFFKMLLNSVCYNILGHSKYNLSKSAKIFLAIVKILCQSVFTVFRL